MVASLDATIHIKQFLNLTKSKLTSKLVVCTGLCVTQWTKTENDKLNLTSKLVVPAVR